MYQAFRKSKEKEAEYIREIARLKMDNDTLRSEAKKTDAAINELEEKLRTATKQVSDSKHELDKAHNRLYENASTIGKPELHLTNTKTKLADIIPDIRAVLLSIDRDKHASLEAKRASQRLCKELATISTWT